MKPTLRIPIVPVPKEAEKAQPGGCLTPDKLNPLKPTPAEKLPSWGKPPKVRKK